MKPKAIIFDLWETLGTKNVSVSKQLQEQFALPKTADYLVQYERAVQTHAWQTTQELAASFLAACNLEKNQKNLDFVADVFATSIAGATLFSGIPELLLYCKENGCKIGLLSNTTIFESKALQNLGVAELFDATAFSWENGHLKPTAAAFAAILEKLNVTAEEALFVDDSPINTAAAESLGMQAITFTKVPALKTELEKIFNAS